MSLEYYLCCRKNYYEIISNLDSILEAYDTIYCIAECEDLIHEYIEKNREKSFFLEKREYIIKQINKCNDNINNFCNHEFEEDMIDITPDRSQKITYCKICEYTK